MKDNPVPWAPVQLAQQGANRSGGRVNQVILLAREDPDQTSHGGNPQTDGFRYGHEYIKKR
ncbi:hypothetical protein Pla110_46340 [Polystyrenella longa]|uniref:Uncharacterized protein n=1 Tax=Polystyrenella longa TaxID=2528007 RepID=A0A518CUG8_9PLAN|nr:hypothetical protein Pla110_46340 [Polystyrenella longa]